MTDTTLLQPEFVGYVAATLTSFSFLPQAISVLRTKDTSGLNLTTYAMFTAGVALWLAYGLVTNAWPIIGANALTLTLAGGILTQIVRDRRKAPGKVGGTQVRATG